MTCWACREKKERKQKSKEYLIFLTVPPHLLPPKPFGLAEESIPSCFLYYYLYPKKGKKLSCLLPKGIQLEKLLFPLSGFVYPIEAIIRQPASFSQPGSLASRPLASTRFSPQRFGFQVWRQVRIST
jgi:hypothetical protein